MPEARDAADVWDTVFGAGGGGAIGRSGSGGGEGETPQTGIRRAVAMMIQLFAGDEHWFGANERFAITD